MLNPDFRDMLSALSEHEVDYMVVGAYALAFHGLPRATGDIDIWVRCSPENASRVRAALEAFGAPLAGIAAEDFEEPGNIVQVGVAPRRIDILTSIDGVAFDDAAGSRNTASIDGILVPIIGRQQLIANKRAAGRPQDIADLAWLEGTETSPEC